MSAHPQTGQLLPESLGSAHPVPAHPQRGGVLLRAQRAPAHVEASFFVPAELVVEVTTLGTVTGAPGLIPPVAGIALARGAVATVLDIGSAREEEAPSPPHATSATSATSAAHPRRSYRAGDDWPLPGSDSAVLCNLGGELVALAGGRVVATGTFDAAEGGVLWRDALVPTLDVRALYARAEQAIWTARAAARTRAAAP